MKCAELQFQIVGIHFQVLSENESVDKIFRRHVTYNIDSLMHLWSAISAYDNTL